MIEAVSCFYFRDFVDVDARVSLDRLQVLRSYLLIGELRPLGIDDIRQRNVCRIRVPVLKGDVGFVDAVSCLGEDGKRHDGLLGKFKELDE